MYQFLNHDYTSFSYTYFSVYCYIINQKLSIMKKRKLKCLDLNKKSISILDNLVKGGAAPIDSVVGCANTVCIGPVKITCGIINCDLGNDI